MSRNGSIKAVSLVKWTKTQGAHVSGTVELFIGDRNGLLRLKQSETISSVLPLPATNAFGSDDGIFGAALLAARNGIESGSPGDSSSLPVNYLSGGETTANATAGSAMSMSVPDA